VAPRPGAHLPASVVFEDAASPGPLSYLDAGIRRGQRSRYEGRGVILCVVEVDPPLKFSAICDATVRLMTTSQVPAV
jgi:hypothetical protein